MDLKKRKILLIEDNPVHAEIYRTELEKAGYLVFYTSEDEAALDIIERENPDLILLDLMLDNLSGLDILQKIKKETDGIKVVALTNFKEKDLLEKDRLKGIAGYILKSENTPAEVVRQVKEYF